MRAMTQRKSVKGGTSLWAVLGGPEGIESGGGWHFPQLPFYPRSSLNPCGRGSFPQGLLPISFPLCEGKTELLSPDGGVAWAPGYPQSPA